MTTRTTSKTRQAITMLVLLTMVSAGWPTASASHANDLVMVPTPSDLVPETGRDQVDDPVREATDLLDPVAQEADRRAREATREPQVPATYYRDPLDLFGEDRIGGWGVWSVVGQPTSGTGWEQGTLPGSGGREGIAFGDRDGYAISDHTSLDSFLVSPRISLDALPVEGSPTGSDARGPQTVTVNQTDPVQARTLNPNPLFTVGSAESIMLEVEHRYHFGCQNSAESHSHVITEEDDVVIDDEPNDGVLDSRHTHILCDGSNGNGELDTDGAIIQKLTRVDDQVGVGQDNARALLFLDSPPTERELSQSGTPTPSSRAIPLAHISETQPDSAGNTRFTGSLNPDFYTTRYDLTQYAGRDAWVVFHVNTASTEDDSLYFQRDTTFDQDQDFYGWQLDSVVLEGPAHLRNVKVDQLLNPNALLGAGAPARLVVAPGPDQDPLGMVVLNRGQVTSTVQPTLTLANATSTTNFTHPQITLQPGETQAVWFNQTPDSKAFLADKHGEHYAATFHAELVDVDEQDLFTPDNTVQTTLQVLREPKIRLANPSLQVNPAVSDSGTRVASATFVNAGSSTETVQASLAIDYHDGVDYPDDEDEEDWTDVTITKCVEDGMGCPVNGDRDQTVTLGPGQEHTLTWELSLSDAGMYRVRMDTTVEPDLPADSGGDVQTLHHEAVATTLINLPSRHTYDLQDTDDWNVTFAGDSPPPCDADDLCEYVLDMPSNCSNECKTLVAYVDTDQLQDDPDPNTPIASVRINVTQWMDLPYRSNTGVHQVQLWYGHKAHPLLPWNDLQNGVPDTPDAVPLALGPHPETVLDPNQRNQVLQTYSFMPPSSNDPPDPSLANRLDHYSGRWTTETYQVSAQAIASQWQREEYGRCLPSVRTAIPPVAPVTPIIPIDTGGICTGAQGTVARMQTMPLAAFDDTLNLRFLGSGVGDCGSGGTPWQCPAWRIAEASMVGIQPNGTEVELLRWNGRLTETLGDWAPDSGLGTLLQSQQGQTTSSSSSSPSIPAPSFGSPPPGFAPPSSTMSSDTGINEVDDHCDSADLSAPDGVVCAAANDVAGYIYIDTPDASYPADCRDAFMQASCDGPEDAPLGGDYGRVTATEDGLVRFLAMPYDGNGDPTGRQGESPVEGMEFFFFQGNDQQPLETTEAAMGDAPGFGPVLTQDFRSDWNTPDGAWVLELTKTDLDTILLNETFGWERGDGATFHVFARPWNETIPINQTTSGGLNWEKAVAHHQGQPTVAAALDDVASPLQWFIGHHAVDVGPEAPEDPEEPIKEVNGVEPLSFPFWINNSGSRKGSFDVTFEMAGNVSSFEVTPSFPASPVSLDAGESDKQTFTIGLLDGAEQDHQLVLWINATDAEDAARASDDERYLFNATFDADDDEIPDDVDKCIYNDQGGQSDFDRDGVGDACDEDEDGDGWPDKQCSGGSGREATSCTTLVHRSKGDGVDNCELFNPGQEDTDFDGDGNLIGDLCESTWRLRPVDTLATLDPSKDPAGWPQRFNATDEDLWHRVDHWGDEDTGANRTGVWTNARHPGGGFGIDREWQHSSLQRSMLQTPPMQIPLGDPHDLTFDHRYNFLPGDHGALLVRFLDDADSPTTDWIQVAAKYDHSMSASDHPEDGLDGDQQRYKSDGCGAGAFDLGGCSTVEPARERIPLDMVPLLDYHRAGSIPGAAMGNDASALRIVDLRDGTVLWQQEGMEWQVPPLCDGACNVQFAFRVQTGEHSPGEYPTEKPVGWFIDRFALMPQGTTGYDLAVTDVTLDAEYDWTEMGFGPGDNRTVLTVTLENTGFFQLPAQNGSIQIDVTLQNTDSNAEPRNHTITHRLKQDEVLEGSQATSLDDRNVTVQIEEFEIPEVEGDYRLMVNASIDGDVLGIDVEDGDTTNNCMGVQTTTDASTGNVVLDLIPIPTCAIATLEESLLGNVVGVKSVQATESLTIDVQVIPENGRASKTSAREVPITISNTGNVQVFDFDVRRIITRPDGDSVEQPWRLTESPPIGGSQPLMDLLHITADATPGFEVDESRDAVAVFDEVGRYQVTACLTLPSTGQEVCNDDDGERLLLESWAVFFADDFAGNLEADPAVTAGEVTTNATGPWDLIHGTGRESTTSGWHFGDVVRESYPEDADESIMLPPLDLSSASRVGFNLEHKYDFEEGYDGGRLEVSLDDGDTWRPLTPDPRPGAPGGYPGEVYPGNPMNADNDPLAVTPAWTGSSDGWINSEFDLGQLEDIITDVLLYDYTPDGFFETADPGDRQVRDRTVPGEDNARFERASFHDSWSTERFCVENVTVNPFMESCWYREDMHLGSPPMNPGEWEDHSGEYWWTGYGCTSKCDRLSSSTDPPQYFPTHRLGLNVTLPERSENEGSRLSFWLWWESSPSGFVDPQNYWYQVHQFQGGVWLGEPPQKLQAVQVETRPDGWKKYVVDIPSGFTVPGQTVDATVEFRFDFHYLHQNSNSLVRDFRQRGGLLDNVALELVTSTGVVIPNQTVYYPTNHTAWSNMLEPLVHPDIGNPDDLPGWPTDNGKWMRRETPPAGAPAWNIQDGILDPDGKESKVFLFGTLQDEGQPDEHFDYPADARQRLVTPLIDLRTVGGEEANLTFFESFRFHGRGVDHFRNVWVQVLEPQVLDDIPGPWTRLDAGDVFGAWGSAENAYSTHSGQSGCSVDFVGSPGWCERTINLKSYIGQRVRLGFEIKTDSNEARDLDRSSPSCNEDVDDPVDLDGCYWAIHGLQVNAQTMAGQSMLMRLRAGTDGSVGDGGWTVSDLQLVGFSYGENAAVLPDDDLSAGFRVAPGDTLTLTGQVRNLGDSVDSLELHAEAKLEEDEFGTGPDLPALDFGEGDGEPLEISSLNVAGRNNDARSYALTIAVPDDARGAQYRIDLDLFRHGDVHDDENLGDHQRSFLIDVHTRPTIDLVMDDAITPMTAAADEPIQFRVTALNTGTTTESVQELAFRVTDPSTGAVVETLHVCLASGTSPPPCSVPIQPGGSLTFQTTWDPDPDDDVQGLHQVDAVVRHSYQGATTAPTVGLVLVDQKPIYYQEVFDQDTLAEAGWSSSQTCGQDRDCWRVWDGLVFSGAHSVYIGPDELKSGATHNHQQDVTLAGPAIDLSGLGILEETEFNDSPFNPYLTFQYQSELGDNDGVIVQSRLLESPEDWSTLDSDDYNGQLTGGPLGNPLAPTPPATRDAFTDSQSTWRPATVPLGPDGGVTDLVGEDDVSLGFRFGSDSDDHGALFTVDAVTVSSYGSRVAPAQRHADMVTGADKVFHFLVENRGPAEDTYKVRIADDSHLSAFQVEVLTPELTLTPGQSGLAEVRVKAPTVDLGGGAGGFLNIEVASLGDPNAVTTASITLGYESVPMPDLSVASVTLPSASGEGVQAGEDPTFLVTVVNRGRLPSLPTDLVVHACPSLTGTLSTDLIACRAAGDATLLSRIGLGAFEPGAIQSFTVTWDIPEDMAGPFHVAAEADPDRLLRDPDRSNNLFALPVDVLALNRPDLRVVPGSLQVLRGDEPVHNAVEGDLLRIVGQVENAGTAEARRAEVQLINRFPLVKETVDLAPGDNVTLTTQWRAEAGNWLFQLQVLPGVGEQQISGLDARSASWDLAVEPSGVDASIDPSRLDLRPGEDAQAFLRVVTDRADTTTFTTRIDGDGDAVSLTGLPGRFDLSAGDVTELPLGFTVSPFASDGVHTVRVDLFADPDLPAVASASVDVHVALPQPFTVRPVPLVTDVGTARLQIDVTNHGTRAGSMPLQVTVPDGWQAAAPESVQVDPQTTRTIDVLLTIPDDTPPGDHTVRILSDGTPMASAAVDVTSGPRWQSSVGHVSEDGSGKTVWVNVKNVGNAPGMPFLDLLEGHDGANVDPPLRFLAAGESQLFRVTLPINATQIVLPGHQDATDLPAPGDPGEVHVTHWDLLSPPNVREGETVRVRVAIMNTASTPDPDHQVVLFANGFPAAEQTVSLAAENVTEVELSWVARSGEYVMSVSHGVAAEQTAFDTVMIVDEREDGPTVSTPAGSVLLSILALVGAALVAARGGRRP